MCSYNACHLGEKGNKRTVILYIGRFSVARGTVNVSRRAARALAVMVAQAELSICRGKWKPLVTKAHDMAVNVHLHAHDVVAAPLAVRAVVGLHARLRGCKERRPGDEAAREGEGPHAVQFRTSPSSTRKGIYEYE